MAPASIAVSPSATRWIAATLFAFLLHGLVAWLVIREKSDTTVSDAPPAVMIDFTPLAVSEDAPEQEVAPGPQMSQAEPEPGPRAPRERVDDPNDAAAPVVETTRRIFEEREPVREPEIDVPKLPEIANPEMQLAPTVQAEVKRNQGTKSGKNEREKPVDPKMSRAPKTSAPKPSLAPPATRSAAPSVGNTQVSPMLMATWRSAVMAHLNRHKRRPAGTASGIVLVTFVIDRSGQVISARLARSSGNSALDAEGASLPRRASPLPAPPAGMPSTVTVSVPVIFR